MRYFIFLFFALVIIPSAFADTMGHPPRDYLPGTEDFPLMPGLTLNNTQTMIFSTPQGRIMNFAGHAQGTSAHIIEFYKRTLQNMGWTLQENLIGTFTGPFTFKRDQETVTITLKPHGNQQEILFTFKPL